ncbi:MAG: translation elongation factor Ts [Alphaproteobacteria bacterium]|nr:translation elongation factor Ts [Alphaproteobacteria bacterium]
MAEITALLVKTLREKTGAGMMDCKKALNEVDGDLEAAVDWLRKKGLAAAAKKAGRIAAEGLVGIAGGGRVGAVVEVNAETDFVARNPQFQGFVSQVATIVLQKDCTVEELAEAAFQGESATVADEMTRLVAVIGENMNLRRLTRLEVKDGIVATYIHNATAPGLGRIGVLVALESSAPDTAKLQDLGKKLAMHVAAAAPQALAIADVDASLLERERNILIDQARASGRPEEVIQKMVEGRVRKYYEEVVLLEQVYVIDGKTKISQIVEQAAQELGHPVKLTGFVRYALGEGIEKAQSDFAAEVQAQAGIAG